MENIKNYAKDIIGFLFIVFGLFGFIGSPMMLILASSGIIPWIIPALVLIPNFFIGYLALMYGMNLIEKR